MIVVANDRIDWIAQLFKVFLVTAISFGVVPNHVTQHDSSHGHAFIYVFIPIGFQFRECLGLEAGVCLVTTWLGIADSKQGVSTLGSTELEQFEIETLFGQGVVEAGRTRGIGCHIARRRHNMNEISVIHSV